MKIYLILAMFLLIGFISFTQEEITMVVSKYSNNTIEQTGFLDQNGKKDSTWTMYNEDGRVIGTGEYINGVKSGYWFCYNDNGRKIFEVLYVNGEKKKGKQWDDEGHLVDSRKW